MFLLILGSLQKSPMSDERVEYTFFWSIENFSFCSEENGEKLVSPVFKPDELESTSWSIYVYPRGKTDEDKEYISLYLGRISVDDDDEPEEISVNFKLSVLVADGSTSHSKDTKCTFDKGMKCGWPQFVERKNIRRDREDTLIVGARIWKGEGEVHKCPPIFARTRIAVENISFLHVVENFSRLEPNVPNTVSILSESDVSFRASSCFYYIENSSSEGEIIVKLKASNVDRNFFKRKISILDSSGNVVVCQEKDNRFDVDRKDIRKLTVPLNEIEEIQLEIPLVIEKEVDLRSLLKCTMSNERIECTFLWIIENSSFFWQKIGEELESPVFRVDEFEGTSWRMKLYLKGYLDDPKGYISFYFCRNLEDDGPKEISVKYKITPLYGNETIFFPQIICKTFEKGFAFGWHAFQELEKIQQDTLIVSCKMWKGEGKVHQIAPICARTRIAVENISFLHEVKHFSSLEPNHQKTVYIQSEREKGFVVSSSLYFNYDRCCKGEMIVEIASSDSNHILCCQKIYILDACGIKAACQEKDNRFDNERRDIQKLPLSLTRLAILDKKGEYLSGDKLTLFCETSFTTGLEYNKINEIQLELPATAEKETGAEQVSERISDNINQADMEESTAEAERCIFDLRMEHRIEDFAAANEEVCKEFEKNSHFFSIFVSISVFPCGSDKRNEGWLVVRPEVRVRDPNSLSQSFVSLSTISIIDVDGNCRFPRYFEVGPHNINYLKKAFKQAKYLEKSFILAKADELIYEGALVLQCYFHIDIFLKKNLPHVYRLGFLRSIHTSVIANARAKPGDPIDEITVFDFTSQVLTLPRFHESRKRFGVYGVPPATKTSRLAIGTTCSLEDIWTFDGGQHRFLLSVSSRHGHLGRLLLDASPVFRRCVRTPMKEQQERRIDISHLCNGTFLNVLYFLERGDFCINDFENLVEVYKFSHMYEMENLQQKCARHLVESAKSEYELEKIKRIADTFSDGNLSNMLESHSSEFRDSKRLKMDDRSNLDCYI